DAGGILGYDGVGIVEGVGGDVRDFNVGDEVYYCGCGKYEGCKEVLELVDEGLVGKKGKNI
ncbi:alcohol dehydrogenase catalytic domain-containing protein, partial [Staphylococcus saprophyticus]|uniref:alcohol dehydrogenase catalytic domain-containing protein n=1 Tax=Staphylococcus saprophyticus TaxID=29385 RepID=UPI00164248DD